MIVLFYIVLSLVKIFFVGFFAIGIVGCRSTLSTSRHHDGDPCIVIVLVLTLVIGLVCIRVLSCVCIVLGAADTV